MTAGFGLPFNSHCLSDTNDTRSSLNTYWTMDKYNRRLKPGTSILARRLSILDPIQYNDQPILASQFLVHSKRKLFLIRNRSSFELIWLKNVQKG